MTFLDLIAHLLSLHLFHLKLLWYCLFATVSDMIVVPAICH